MSKYEKNNPHMMMAVSLDASPGGYMEIHKLLEYKWEKFCTLVPHYTFSRNFFRGKSGVKM
jgi:hypothetical protein